MIRIAFNLGGTSHLRANEDAFPIAAMRKSRRVVERFPRDDLFRPAHVGNDFFLWLTAACRQPGESKRRRHELKKMATADSVIPLARIFGKLPMQIRQEIRAVRPLLETFPETRPSGIDLNLGRKWKRFHGGQR